MELFDEHHEPLQHLLGWTNFEKSHVVNIGKVQNNDATTELNSDVYDVLWEANKLDFPAFGKPNRPTSAISFSSR